MGICAVAKEAFKDGVEKGKWPDAMIKYACARAGLNAVGTDAHPELRELAEQKKEPYSGLIKKTAFGLGYAWGYLT